MKINHLKLLFISLILIFIGIFLSVSFIPIQDINLLSNEDLLQFQKDTSINYPLGTFTFWSGTILFVYSLIIVVYKQILKIKKKSALKN